MSVIKIIRGRQHGAARVAIYGVEGIGKSTLAAAFPSPVILDTEDGTRHLEAARVRIDDWKTLTLAVAELAVQPQGFRTVVIDSIDWAETLLRAHLKAKLGKPVDDLPYGRGFGVLSEAFQQLVDAADGLIANGLNVVFVGHSEVKRCTPPDMEEGFDRYELKLSKKVAPIVKEWADALLFANYRVKLIEGADGRTKAIGGKERILYAERSAAWDAKNRFGLAAELPMTIEALGPLFGPVKPAARAADEPLTETIHKHIAEAKAVRTLGRIGDRIDELSSQGDLSDEEVAELMGAINARHQQLEPQAEAAT